MLEIKLSNAMGFVHTVSETKKKKEILVRQNYRGSNFFAGVCVLFI